MKTAVIAAGIKGVVIATVVLAVVKSSLSAFQQALIIAAVGATITGLFTILGAWIAVRAQRPIRKEVQDIKGKVEADRRASDVEP